MYQSILKDLEPTKTLLVAVSKTKPQTAIQELYDQGQRHFGENRVQELVEKHEALPKDIHWHLIGSLQKNKVKYVAPFVHLIHSVDSLPLLQTINKEGMKHNRRIKVLLQFKIATEDTKAGLEVEQAHAILSQNLINDLEHVEIVGVMGMASFTSDSNQVRLEFKNLRSIFDDLESTYFSHQSSFKHISMGMSGDYKIAIAEGSTMVRIGSLLFGNR